MDRRMRIKIAIGTGMRSDMDIIFKHGYENVYYRTLPIIIPMHK